MSLAAWLDNLAAYSLQVAILAAAGTLLAVLLRLHLPSVAVAYWQALLALCLLLPVLQPWQRTVLKPVDIPAPEAGVGIPLAAPSGGASPRGFSISYPMIACVLGLGVALRLLWLAAGLACLHLHRRRARPLLDLSPALAEASDRVPVSAEFYLSSEIDSPVTFGLRKPAILFPVAFADLPPALQLGIACHELLHVRRRDWAVILLENLAGALLWFHPAVAWLLSRIRITREQVVDRQVVALLGDRKPYLDALLEVARLRTRFRPLPAPLFLKERHLARRVALLLKEVSMSRTRIAITLSALAILVAGTARLAIAWFPLSQEVVASPMAQTPVRGPIRVGSNVQQSKLISKVDPVLPPEAAAARVAGTVIVQATVDERGDVSDTIVLRGHPLLDKAALDAVRQWKYAPTYLEGQAVAVIATVMVPFGPRPAPVLVTVDESGKLRDPATGAEGDELVQRLKGATSPVHVMAGTEVPLQTLERVVNGLQRQGIQNFRIGGAFTLHDGRLFYEVGGPARPGSPLVEPPQLALEGERLRSIARASGRADEIPRSGGPSGSRVLLYRLYINEVSEILSVEVLRGPKLSEVEAEIARTRVIMPARLGPDPVPVVANIEIAVEN